VSKRQDEAKARFWQGTIREAARSGVSIREFCRQRKLNVAQFYWWRRRLKETWRRTMRNSGAGSGVASFALVSDEPGAADAGIELVLGDGRRLRIGRGVDEATLRSVLAALQAQGC